MAGLSASGLKTQIRSYTEVDSNVLSDSVLENIILNAQYRILEMCLLMQIEKQSGNLVPGQETINVQQELFLLEVYRSMIQAPCLQDLILG